MAENKQKQVLSNGEEVKTTKDGWNPKDEKVLSAPCLIEGWGAGSLSHHSNSYGFVLATKDKIPGAYIGDFEAVDKDGNTVLKPVFNGAVINEAMREATAKIHDMDVQAIRVAGNRTAAKQELDEIKKEAANLDEATLAILKEKNVALYEKLTGNKVEEEESGDEPEEEDSD